MAKYFLCVPINQIVWFCGATTSFRGYKHVVELILSENVVRRDERGGIRVSAFIKYMLLIFQLPLWFTWRVNTQAINHKGLLWSKYLTF